MTSFLKKTLIAGTTALTLAAGIAAVPSAADARGFGGHGGFGGGHFGGGRGYGRGYRGYGRGFGYGLGALALGGLAYGAYNSCGYYGGYYGGCGYGYGRPYGYGAYGYGY